TFYILAPALDYDLDIIYKFLNFVMVEFLMIHMGGLNQKKVILPNPGHILFHLVANIICHLKGRDPLDKLKNFASNDYAMDKIFQDIIDFKVEEEDFLPCKDLLEMSPIGMLHNLLPRFFIGSPGEENIVGTLFAAWARTGCIKFSPVKGEFIHTAH
ncbi:hypothetical protein ACJX0J_007510, partial [Zea mays]